MECQLLCLRGREEWGSQSLEAEPISPFLPQPICRSQVLVGSCFRKLSLSFLLNPNISPSFQGHFSLGVYLMSTLKSVYAVSCSLKSLGFQPLLFSLHLRPNTAPLPSGTKFCSPKAVA